MNALKRLFVVFVLAAATACGGGSDESVEVEYYVSNGEVLTSARASVTFSPGPGLTSQATATMPWRQKFKAKDGDFLYVAAQSFQASGRITASIYVDGKLLRTSSSTGAYAIASASARCC